LKTGWYASVGAGEGSAGVRVGDGDTIPGDRAVSVPGADGVGNSVVGKLQAKMESNRARKAKNQEKGWVGLIVILMVIYG
jgi:hypothetical protein